MTACRYAAVPGHVCAGPVHLHLAGHLCEVAAPPTQPQPPAGTTLTDLQTARNRTSEARMSTDDLGPDFGPQTEHVTALLARARALTTAEQEAIVRHAQAMAANLRDAKRATAVLMGWRDPHVAVAAIRTHLDRAPDPDRHGALFAAWRHGFHSTSVPILGDVLAWTALALAGRDVIPGDAYEALTRSWAQVVGRAHPDDVRTLEDSMFPAGVAR